ncbi:hypothetical protein BS47DRAFT_1364935 [Hydnum rufescens UP504]|uniref:Uncharacterized protein n=1 Tax=Hydnum rufescens UP504 TaxID=1448309 RepID=A0A9P6AQ53_9AGAM|nr:hypothetical protein BS47DRAFT_1364935 [Hydnum rufescens UP504]
MGEQQPAHQTKPMNGNQKHNTSTGQTTHLLWRVPSLHENPHTDEPQVHAATQAQSACPLNMTIDKIAYHTPAAHKNPLHKKATCAATHNPQLDPRAQHPNTHKYTMTDEIPHTHCGGCVVIAGLPSMHKTPPNKNTDEKPMCAATHNPIQEPAAASQNEYHTCFGGCVLQGSKFKPLK